MSAIEAPGHPWRGEIRAMLALSWPMILTNLGQTAMTATDVLMMGRLGPDALLPARSAPTSISCR